jgi:nitrous oxidase accessory protein NosD
MVATIVSFAAVGALVLQPLPSMAQSDNSSTGTTTGVACGEVVSGVVNLTTDLVCSDDGLIIGKDNTVVNMNGHSITGPGTGSSKVGFMVPNTDDVSFVGPGSITKFQAGVLITGSNHVKINSIILQGNEIAIFSTGSDGAQIEKNIIDGNNIGIASHSSKNLKADINIFTGNPLAAVTLVNTHAAEISTNTAEGSQNGIFVDQQSTDNKVTSNNAHKNIIDINNANGMPPNIGNNAYSDNNCDVSTPSGLCSG